jgi:hypothetical protein
LLFFTLNLHDFGFHVSPLNLFEFANVHPALYQLSASMSMVMEPVLTMLADVAPLLHEVTLHGTCHVSSREVCNFIRRCKRLDYLVLWHCRLPARCFPEAQRLYDPAFPHFRLRAAELAKIRNNTHIDFSYEDDELQPIDDEEAWMIAPLPRIGNQPLDLDISDDDNSDFDNNDSNHNSDINGENELDNDDELDQNDNAEHNRNQDDNTENNRNQDHNAENDHNQDDNAENNRNHDENAENNRNQDDNAGNNRNQDDNAENGHNQPGQE